MNRPVFGRKISGIPPGPPPSGGGAGAGGSNRATMPWVGTPNEIAGNLAFTHLSKNLPIRLEAKGRVHAETLLAAAGAVCGYCCQQAVYGRIAEGATFPTGQLMTIQGQNGQTYHVGNAILQLIFGSPDPAIPDEAILWRIIAGTAVSRGISLASLPTPDEIMGPMAETLGTADEGRPSTGPNHQPVAPIHELLPIVWPLAHECLIGRFAVLGNQRYPAPLGIWPEVSAWAATRLFVEVLPVLDPRTAMLLVMQSAAFGSKLDSQRVLAAR